MFNPDIIYTINIIYTYIQREKINEPFDLLRLDSVFETISKANTIDAIAIQ